MRSLLPKLALGDVERLSNIKGLMVRAVKVRWLSVVKYSSSSTGSIVLLAVLLLTCALYRWFMWGVEMAPPGSDGGNWLAFSMELFGEKAKAASAVYPPLFPGLVKFTILFMPPLVTLKVLGLMTTVLVSIPAYLLLRTTLNPLPAALLAASFPLLDYHNDVLAWGGYPQLLGAAFLMASIYTLRKGLETGRVRLFIMAALGVALTVATHTLAALQLAIALGALLLIYFYEYRSTTRLLPQRRLVKVLRLWVGVTVVLLLVIIPVYIKTLALLTENPFNSQQFHILEFFRNYDSWRPGNIIWLEIAAVSIPFTAWAVIARRRYFLADVVVALSVSAVLTFVVIQEIRSAHLLQIGLFLSVGLLIKLAYSEATVWLAHFSRQIIFYLAIAFLTIVVSGVLMFGVFRAQQATQWYRVVDTPVLTALNWLRDNGAPGDRVVAGETPNGGIIGWWVEGYAKLPVYFAVEKRWLSFDEEREQAEIAHRFLALDAEPAELRQLVERHRIRFLLFHKETLVDPLPDLTQAGFINSFENETMIIFSYGEIKSAP